MKYLLLSAFLLLSSGTAAQEIRFISNSRLVLGVQKEKSASISIGDIDGDGDQDAVVANGRHWPQQNQIFYNDGRGIFTVSRPLDDLSETSYATELADFDGDGDLDIRRKRHGAQCLVSERR